jgi:hypothetical protein
VTVHILLETGLLRQRRLGEFVYAQDVIDGRAEVGRAAVKYAITRPGWGALSP